VKSTLLRLVNRFQFTLLLLGILAVWMWLRPEPEAPDVYQLDGRTMGTSYRVLITEFPTDVSGEELAAGITERLHRIDKELMSTYEPTSELSQFNQSLVGEWFDVSPEMAIVMQEALAISELTGGAFDVTVGPLVDLWGFGPEMRPTRVPDDATISQLLAEVGYQHLSVSMDPPRIRRQRDVRVDLSGIAKGYGADYVAEYFDSLAMDSYFIEIGGELRIKGTRGDGSSWVPGIEQPVNGTQEVHRIINTHDEPLGVAGSGDYRNYFEQDGQRYSHEIDPLTGRPIMHNLAAAYVIAENAMRADALATAFMVMGAEASLALAEKVGLAAYFIVKSEGESGFDTVYSRQFTRYLEEES
jgi:thiamine biosynthesis lipoprotein